MRIVEKWQDVAGKWRVKVALNENESVILKFQENPSDEVILAETNKYLKSIANLPIDEEAEKLKLVRNIPLKDLKIKLGIKDGSTN